jgi:murein DD-endopeptidase MepM/ murein hydrolase activator NlpD
MLLLPSVLPQQALQSDESARIQRLQAQLTSGGHTPHGKPQDVKSAAAELSSLFVSQMLAVMRRTVPQSGLLNKGFAHDTYVSMFDQEIARIIARREDFGLTAMLQRQLKDLSADRQVPGRPLAALPRPSAISQPPTVSSVAQKETAIDAYRQPSPLTDSRFMIPVEGRYTSGFGIRVHPSDHAERLHGGMDIAAPAGTPIRAAAAGQVVLSGTQSGDGNVIVVQHAEGYSTLYAHNMENLVPVGTTVSQGQRIATVGDTGRATGPHLHFEIRKDGKRLDPVTFLTAGNVHKPAPFLVTESS